MLPEANRPNDATILHQRLLAGDLTASAEIAELYLPSLVEYMKARFKRVKDPHLVEMAAIDAMWNYLRRPQQYDPAKMRLESYLRMAARYDLLNLLAKHNKEALKGRQVVELDAPGAEHEIKYEAKPRVKEQVEILASPIWQRLRELLPNPADLEIVLLMMEDVHETKEYAAVLGITHLSSKEQAQEVKRHKDRIKKRLQRHMQRSELADHD